MKSRKDIVENWLPRYTGVPLNEFGEYILLTNFDRYVELFAHWNRVPVHGRNKPMTSATAHGITIINFGMGSALAATVMDLLSAVEPRARELGCCKLTLEVLSGNGPAMASYKRFGFAQYELDPAAGQAQFMQKWL